MTITRKMLNEWAADYTAPDAREFRLGVVALFRRQEFEAAVLRKALTDIAKTAESYAIGHARLARDFSSACAIAAREALRSDAGKEIFDELALADAAAARWLELLKSGEESGQVGERLTVVNDPGIHLDPQPGKVLLDCLKEARQLLLTANDASHSGMHQGWKDRKNECLREMERWLR
jgi:hypothetical protein